MIVECIFYFRSNLANFLFLFFDVWDYAWPTDQRVFMISNDEKKLDGNN